MPYVDFRHRLPLRVRWAEVDLQGVVFNGHYLAYCDVCVTEYWRAIGMTYPGGLSCRRLRSLRAQGHARVSRSGPLRRRTRGLWTNGTAGHDEPAVQRSRCTGAGRPQRRSLQANSSTSTRMRRASHRSRCRRPAPTGARVRDDSARGTERACCALSWATGMICARGRHRSGTRCSSTNRKSRPTWKSTSGIRSRSTLSRSTRATGVGTGRLLPDGHIGRMAVLPTARGAGTGSALLTVADGRSAPARASRRLS